MSARLDHLIVPSRDGVAAARLLARLLDVPGAEQGSVGPFFRGPVYRSLPHGPSDSAVNRAFGGHLAYWSEPDGHVREALTVSYERQPADAAAARDGA